MITSRVKRAALAGLLASLMAIPALAQTTAEPADGTGRGASFLPLPTETPPPVPVTAPAVPATPPVPGQAAAPALAAPPPAAPASAPVDLGKPVEAAQLADINPESIGLMAPTEGGLGAAMWKGTPRALVTRLLPLLNLPVASPTLNNLAKRLLLTVASVPEGEADNRLSLTAMRVEKLVALGDAKDAWKLAFLAKPDQIDEITLRLAAESALASGTDNDVCARLPDITKNHSAIEWQKLLLVCQLRANDMKAAQVTLDLLHTQNVKDDIYFYIAEKNIVGGNKQAPRQLTPLRPLTLALLRLADLPLPGELYARPDAALIPELLQAKAREESVRIGLAERTASRGLIGGSDLTAVYRSIAFAPDRLINAANSPEPSPRLHALLYQAALQEKIPQNRVADAVKFMQTATPALLNGAGAQALAEMVDGVPMTADFNNASATMAYIYTLANKPDLVLEWIKFAKHAAIGLPVVTAGLQSFWPLRVLSGLESEKDYGADLGTWLDAVLKPTDPKIDNRAQREQAAAILLLLDAAGFEVADEDWARVADMTGFERRMMPPAFLFERLRAAGASNHRGESVLFGLLLSGGRTDESSLLTTVATVRALRLAGLTSDAAMLAREAIESVVHSDTGGKR